ncbi:MAG: hypothetical protein A2539_10145 [Elusimicrobia bacterium RIFOXYD2_FULL_34_15]|nr:MAG: hypothetical protein A2539_10145 [Elusimicrobia bacterium RIFOXYD2_FULL_34_15]
MKKLFLILRIIIFLLIILLIFQPVKKVYNKRNIPSVALLIDNSLSMGNVSTREFEKVKSILKSQFIGNAMVSPHYFSFSSDIKELTEKDIQSLKIQGSKTDILGALEKTKTNFLGKNLDGIILFSDGNQNVEKDDFEILNELSNLKIPVLVVKIEQKDIQKNISISKIEIPEIIFRNTNAIINIKIHTFGFTNKNIPIYLKSGNNIIQTKTLNIQNDGMYELAFEITPDKAGVNNYSIETPTYQGEKSYSDNIKKFTLEVEPEKIRILYLCGQPSFNYSFLRTTLKNDPNIELVSFIILRNPENIVAVPDSELSLIPFPVDEIFSREIFNFDMLIFDNFNYSRFAINPQYLVNIRNFVIEYGKAFLIISGEIPLSIYQNTPISEILPVNPTNEISQDKFSLNILKPDNNILKFSDDNKENISILKNLPELDTINISTIKEKTTLLAESEKSKYPVITISDMGKGRVMCITTPSLWRLALGSENPYKYVKLWGQSIKWLTNSSSMKQVAIFTKKSYNIGDSSLVKIKVKDEYFKPVNNAVVNLIITKPDSKKETVNVPPEIENGEYGTKIPLELSGTYKLEVYAYYNRKYLGEDSISLSVFDISRESEDIMVNEPFLKQISDKTNGTLYSTNSFNYNELKIKPRITKSDVLYEINIWNKTFTYLILIILLCLEWYLRRKYGLL